MAEVNRVRRIPGFEEQARFYEALLGKPRGSFVAMFNGTPCFYVPDVTKIADTPPDDAR